MTVVLPPSRVAIAGNAPPSREWYRFFQDSLQVNLDVDSLQERVDDLTVRVTALEDAPASSTPTRIIGYGSIYVSATAIKTVTLDGDAEDPGFTTYYGTDTTGEKGWYAVAATLADSSNVVKSTDAVGVTSFDLTDVTVASTGGTLKKRSFDAKGRLSAEASATTTDLTEGTNLYYTDARADARITLQKGQPSGLATLDAGGKLDAGQLPALAITETFVVNTQAAMLALGAQEGDVAVRTDLSKSFILTADPPSTLANWQELLTPTGAVTSFNGRTGSVVPASGDYTKAQVGLGNVDNTSDADKPVSTAQAAADNLRMPKTGGDFTGDISATNLKPNLTVTDWNSYDTNPGAFFPSCVAGSANGPGPDYYSGVRVFRSGTGSGAEIVARETAASISELWFRGWSGGSTSGWKQAATVDMLATDSGWQAMSPQSGWSNSGSPYATCACRKLGSFVTLRGAITGGTLTNGTTVCTIPSGYRPPSDLQFAISSTSTDPTARMIVRSSGAVQIYGVNAASVALDGTSYFVD